MTVYTAIFNNYDILKEPQITTKGCEYICYTNTNQKSDIWQIRKVPAIEPQLTARKIKILFHQFTEQENSIWVDGSFKINCNLNDWWERHFKPDITCISHPLRDCVYEEANACIAHKRKGIDLVEEQVSSYTIPPHSGLIQSGILMRQRTDFTIKLCEEWWNELSKFSLRDQISFAKVSYQQPINYIKWDYRSGREFIYYRHSKSIRTY